MQLQQLTEAVRADLSGHASEEARKQAMAEYDQRFITARLDASCLIAPSSGQSSTVNKAFTGGDLFQASSLHDFLTLACMEDGVPYRRGISSMAWQMLLMRHLFGLILQNGIHISSSDRLILKFDQCYTDRLGACWRIGRPALSCAGCGSQCLC